MEALNVRTEYLLGRKVYVAKPKLIDLEKISANEFFYLQSIAGDYGNITEVKLGNNQEMIFTVSYKSGKHAKVHEQDIIYV